MNLFNKYTAQVLKYPKFAELLVIIFDPELQYFRTNNQLENKTYVPNFFKYSLYYFPCFFFYSSWTAQPWLYYPPCIKDNTELLNSVLPGSLIDALKYSNELRKATWTRAELIRNDGSSIEVRYLHDSRQLVRQLPIDTIEIDSLSSRSLDFQWRMSLKEGDLIDCCDVNGMWYVSTVVKVRNGPGTSRLLKVGFRRYVEKGEKVDSKGNKFEGLSEVFDEDNIDATSPKVQKPETIAKIGEYSINKHHSDVLNDYNDLQFQEINGEKIMFIPRSKFMSGLLFRIGRKFIKEEGFAKLINHLKSNFDVELLVWVVGALGNISQNLHKKYACKIAQELRPIVHAHLYDYQNEDPNKKLTKEREEFLFQGLKNLMRRYMTYEQFKLYESSEKLGLALICLNSDTLKRRIQGISQLKDILKNYKSLTPTGAYGSVVLYKSTSTLSTDELKIWLKENKIFQKIYMLNSHVQLVKRSTDFLRFLITEDSLEVEELALLLKAAHKSDYETKISIYKLLEDVSRNFKKQHIQFLIDEILDTNILSVLCEDIELLYELSHYSNYFPLEKVVPYFENIIVNGASSEDSLDGKNVLFQSAIKKYTDIVSKKYEMRTERMRVIEKFMNRLKENFNPLVVVRVLKNIIENVSIGGECNKYDILDFLQKSSIDRIVLETIAESKKESNSSRLLQIEQQLLNFIKYLATTSTRVKISMEVFIDLWRIMVKESTNNAEKQLFYTWCGDISKGDCLAEDDKTNKESSSQHFHEFFEKLTEPEQLSSVNDKGFQIIKHVFIEVNKRENTLTVSTVYRNHREVKLYKLRVPLKSLVFYQRLVIMIYNVADENVSRQAVQFFNSLYTTQNLNNEERQNYYEQFLKDFYDTAALPKDTANRSAKMIQVLKLLECVIDQSQKNGSGGLQCLNNLRSGEMWTLQIYNEITFVSDAMKKTQISVSSNTSVFELRTTLAAQFGINWQELVMTHMGEEITQLHNSRTLKQIKLKLSQLITCSKKAAYLIPEEPLIENGKLVPKAVRAITIAYKRYADTEGKMDKERLKVFIGANLGDMTKSHEDRVAFFLKTYDSENRGYLLLEHFIDFYTGPAKQKPSIVWGNFRNLGIRNDLTTFDDPQDVVSKAELPRYLLGSQSHFYEALFELIDDRNMNVASTTWAFLERLPISQTIYHQMMAIHTDFGNKQTLKWDIFDKNSPYKLLYVLHILDYLAEGNVTANNGQKWVDAFIECRGYEKLFSIFSDLNNFDQIESIESSIMQYLIRLLNGRLTRVFPTPTLHIGLSILSSGLDFEQILSYVKNKGLAPKSSSAGVLQQYKKLEEATPIVLQGEWHGLDREAMSSQIIKFIKKQSNHKSQKAEKDHHLEQALTLLLSLLADQSCQEKIGSLLQILSSTPSTSHNGSPLAEADKSNPIKIYRFILALVLSTENNQIQKQILAEFFTLLKTDSNLSTRYFKTLSVLVAKIGIPENLENVPQMLLSRILEDSREQVIEGCALLLTHMPEHSLQVEPIVISKLFTRCLFGSQNVTCKTQTAREAVYDLLIKLSHSQQITEKLSYLTVETLQKCVAGSRVITANDLLPRSPFGYAGMKNLGNICYMLAMLQQFFTNTNLRNLVFRIEDKKEPLQAEVMNSNTSKDAVPTFRTVDDNLLHQFIRLFAYLQHTQRQDFNPQDFCYSFKDFSGMPVNVTIQQDAQEFISMFFDQMEKTVKETPFRHVFEGYYGGKYSNIMTCDKCQAIKAKEQTFYSLSLEVKNSKTLAESFNKLTLGETINDFRCDFCNQKSDLHKTTKISLAPNYLILHLQRIVFNLDTLLNEKINSKLEFPVEFNILPYTRSSNDPNVNKDDYEYTLSGVVAHYGTADYGHYYSFIKTGSEQWLEFNDSKISDFNIKNLETECFGGQSQYILEDEFELGKKENSKNAYILIYEKKLKHNIKLSFRQGDDVEGFMKNLRLKSKEQEQLQSSKNLQGQQNGEELATETKKEQAALENLDTPSKLPEEDEFEETPVFRKLSKQYEEELDKPEIADFKGQSQKDKDIVQDSNQQHTQASQNQQVPQPTEKLVELSSQIPPPPSIPYFSEVEADNNLYELEANICSTSFLRFYSRLLQHKHLPPAMSADIYHLTQKLCFGIWLKNPCLKQVMNGLESTLANNPFVALELIKTESLPVMLLENSDTDLRVCIANLLAKSVNSLVSSLALSLSPQDKEQTNQIVLRFLDTIFSHLPVLVAKNWIKFGQYFEFWKLIADQKGPQFNYLIRKKVISHFLDFFLEKKSPLGIYANKKYPFGNSYVQPNFIFLIATVSEILKHIFTEDPKLLTGTDKQIVLDSAVLDKLINDKNEELVNKIISLSCLNSIETSEKVAIMLLRGIKRVGYTQVQPYLEAMHTYLTIKDRHQRVRVEWIFGVPNLSISTISKQLIALNSFSVEDRLYNFDSPLHIDNLESLFEQILKNYLKQTNFCTFCLKAIMKLVLEDGLIYNYVAELPPPSLIYGKFYNFLEEFAHESVDDSKRYPVIGYNKEELAKSAAQMVQQFISRVKANKPKAGPDNPQKQKQELYGQTEKSLDAFDKNKTKTKKSKILDALISRGEDRKKISAQSKLGTFEEGQSWEYEMDSGSSASLENHCPGKDGKDLLADRDEEFLDQKIDVNDALGQREVYFLGDGNHNMTKEQLIKMAEMQNQSQIQPLLVDFKEDPEIQEGHYYQMPWQQEQQSPQGELIDISGKKSKKASKKQKPQQETINFSGKDDAQSQKQIKKQKFKSNDEKMIDIDQRLRKERNPFQNAEKLQSDNQISQNSKKPVPQEDQIIKLTQQQPDQQEYMNVLGDNGLLQEQPAIIDLKDYITSQQYPIVEELQECIKIDQEEEKMPEVMTATNQQAQTIKFEEVKDSSQVQASDPYTKFMNPTASGPVSNSEESDSSQAVHPYSFTFVAGQTQTINGVTLTKHHSVVTYIRTQPNNKKNLSLSSSFKKIMERIPKEVLDGAWTGVVRGIFVTNPTRDYVRLKWKYGTCCLRPVENAWVWTDEIIEVTLTTLESQRNIDKMTFFPDSIFN